MTITHQELTATIDMETQETKNLLLRQLASLRGQLDRIAKDIENGREVFNFMAFVGDSSRTFAEYSKFRALLEIQRVNNMVTKSV